MTLGVLFGGDLSWTALLLVFALLLDSQLGEPDEIWGRVPHPAKLMGAATGWLDARLNRETDPAERRRRKGVLAVLLLIALAFFLGWLVQSLPYLGPALAALAAAALLAQKSLVDHVAAVARALETGLAEGRAAVSQIVGRDPESLDEPGVARAAIESGAENFSDGVVAPALWFLLAGLPGLVVYKMINTADSMIGHRAPRYAAFGWAAARLDDLLNLAPARLSALLLALSSRRPLKALRVVWRDAGKHASPNAGWPEAATAGALDVALAGPRAYGGAWTEDPYIHPGGRKRPGPTEIDLAAALIGRAHVLLVALLVLLVAVAPSF